MNRSRSANRLPTPVLFALTWVIATTIGFAPLVPHATRPDVGMILFQGVIGSAMIIMLTPMVTTRTNLGYWLRMHLWPIESFRPDDTRRLAAHPTIANIRLAARNANFGPSAALPYVYKNAVATLLLIFAIDLPGPVFGIWINMVLGMTAFAHLTFVMCPILAMAWLGRQPSSRCGSGGDHE